MFLTYDQISAKNSTNLRGQYRKHIRWHFLGTHTISGNQLKITQRNSDLYINSYKEKVEEYRYLQQDKYVPEEMAKCLKRKLYKSKNMDDKTSQAIIAGLFDGDFKQLPLYYYRLSRHINNCLKETDSLLSFIECEQVIYYMKRIDDIHFSFWF